MEASTSDSIFTTQNIFWLTSIIGGIWILYEFYQQWSEKITRDEFAKQKINYVRWGNLFMDFMNGVKIEKKLNPLYLTRFQWNIITKATSESIKKFI